jgi:RNA polymerase sigma factor (sigma-70 family)
MGRMDFESLLKRITPRLKAIARKLDGKYSLFDDEDLYQEGLLHLWDKYKRKQLYNKTDSFILQGCYFFLKNYIRKRYKKLERNLVSLDDNTKSENEVFEGVLSSEGIERQAIDINLLIEDIRKTLSGKEKDVFSLYLENLTTREIGKRLSISHVMVVKLEKRIREKCRGLKEKLN